MVSFGRQSAQITSMTINRFYATFPRYVSSQKKCQWGKMNTLGKINSMFPVKYTTAKIYHFSQV